MVNLMKMMVNLMKTFHVTGLRARGQAGESGQSLVEFAIVIPVLVLVVFGIVQFGVLYNSYIQLTNAANTGARLFSIERGQANPCQDVLTAVDNAAASLNNSTLIVTMTSYTATSGAGSLSTTTWTGNSTSNPVAASSCPWTPSYSTPGTMVSSDPATISVSYPYSLSFLGLKINSGSLSVGAIEAIE
jgi:Flp pilus assembly protein TadG